jgi:hypothetical protein
MQHAGQLKICGVKCLPLELFGSINGSPRFANVLELRRRILTRNGFAHALNLLKVVKAYNDIISMTAVDWDASRE